MPIAGLLQNHAFGPEEIEILTVVFEDTLRQLRLPDRKDLAAEIVAKKIIELAQSGERDPVRLRELTVKSVLG
jgi:hypothetical protein